MKPLQGLKNKGPADDSSSSDSSAEDEFLSAAFEAANSGDEGAFKNAMRKAIRLCVQREVAIDYDEDDEEA